MKTSKIDQKTKFNKRDTAIHVTVPAKVAYNLKDMQKITETVLGRLGCPACHSGFDIRFDFERRFNFNENLELLEH